MAYVLLGYKIRQHRKKSGTSEVRNLKLRHYKQKAMELGDRLVEKRLEYLVIFYLHLPI